MGPMPPAVKKGMVVLYVSKLDFDIHDEVPNICAAIVTKVRPADGVTGKPESVALHVFTPTGSFSDDYVTYTATKERGTWHFME